MFRPHRPLAGPQYLSHQILQGRQIYKAKAIWKDEPENVGLEEAPHHTTSSGWQLVTRSLVQRSHVCVCIISHTI